MSVTAAMVKELRQRTGSGMMECRKALRETEGDMDLAIENMRKAGLAKADKKSSRIAAEGRIAVAQSADTKSAVIIDVNCETDFVAKGDTFKEFANAIAEAILASDVSTLEQANELALADGKTIDETRRGLISKLGENITLRRFQKVATEGGTGFYLHGEKIGVLVDLAKADSDLAKDVAMHIAASKPQCVAEADVAAETIEKEKAIFVAQAEESGKPAAIIEKMIGGRIRKFLAEITLEGQAFIKDDKVTVGKLVSGKDNKVLNFIHLEVGEGIEKAEGDFASEVMAQIRGEA
ncbi:elongation factor Ts [Bathymodiolus platifrons methanotrophic gill symbiont]|uniref:translation elongation factor Ts n=1 Tax=Bathymodiolus platifrons methanotrophic gill symbiont TaxID=113268 RepID=UPI000B41B754|nr:translation elongation factor Ts [Bathymodiolus platifrons methanotrophic gill symbiont]MCK5870823.1 elongation factor Ts [Methyloprofundus sp.]TXK95059.1 translation elongation factor Ts [Methylococcaceae bacterium CS4]TXK96107.1 translation elongation factor Ts [Methylococcaceae bacterium CS5]TXL06114.1 translation elongation factor Ts [Methylococcaceae bacterium CS3]TXL08264.1 translation elongation factor Ts [Methylococcaceae bacterium CS1]TXL10037.1 translation elongation factor Ts [M